MPLGLVFSFCNQQRQNCSSSPCHHDLMKLLSEVLKTRTANEIQILKEGVFYAPNYFGNNWKEHMQKQGRPLELGLT